MAAHAWRDITVCRRSPWPSSLDSIWVIVAACLVFLMNLGFACVESGFCRAKDPVTIMAKNFFVFAVSSVAFLPVGFGIM